MTVPAFGEASARGRKQGASSRDRKFGVLAGAGATTAAIGGAATAYGIGGVTAAKRKDVVALESLKESQSKAQSTYRKAGREYKTALKLRDAANSRFDDFQSWRAFESGDSDHWTARLPKSAKGDVGGDLRINRTDPRHRPYMDEEHGRLAEQGRLRQAEHDRALRAQFDASEAAREARASVKGFTPTAQNAAHKLKWVTRGGKSALVLGTGALAAGIYGIERGRRYGPKPAPQPRFAAQAAMGRKAEIEQGKAKSAAYKAGLPAGKMSQSEIDSWYVNNYRTDAEVRAASKRTYQGYQSA